MVRKYRKNFLPAFILNLLLWVSWFLVVFFLSPSQNSIFIIHNSKFAVPLNIVLFFLTLTLTLTLTLAFIFGNTRRGFLAALLADGVLFLRLIRQANWLNLLLLGAILLILEIYFSKRRP